MYEVILKSGRKIVSVEVTKLEELYSENARLRAAVLFYANQERSGPWNQSSEDFGRFALETLEAVKKENI